MGMEIEYHRTVEVLERRREKWDELVLKSAVPSFFLTSKWLEPWWRIYGRDFSPLILTAVEDGELVGFAPLMIGRGPDRLLRFARCLMFIGQGGDTASEYLGFVAAPGIEKDVGDGFRKLLTTTLRHFWDVCHFKSVRSDLPAASEVFSAIGGISADAAVARTQVAPFLELPSSWEDCLAGRSRNFRSRWRNTLNRIEGGSSARLLIAGDGIGADEALDHVADLNRRRWGDRGQSFLSSRYQAFHRELVGRLTPGREVLLAVLEVDGKIVAGRYDFLFAGRILCFQGGWSPECRRLRPGLYLTGKVIQWGIEHGFVEYDFLAGGADYKDQWSSGQRNVHEYLGYNTNIRGRAFRALRGLKRAMTERSGRQGPDSFGPEAADGDGPA